MATRLEAARLLVKNAASSRVAISPSLSWIAWCSQIGLPKVCRCCEYFSASSSAAFAMPTPRAATLMRPSSSPPTAW
ncbi:hypothetical protein D3C83_90000 [compost metagenome]